MQYATVMSLQNSVSMCHILSAYHNHKHKVINSSNNGANIFYYKHVAYMWQVKFSLGSIMHNIKVCEKVQFLNSHVTTIESQNNSLLNYA
jgi:hypothetical protein